MGKVMIRSIVQFNFKVSHRPQVLAGGFRRRGGFSLIEVAIALAIFVFGALAIVRIFPGALGVVQNSEQRAIGQRMAQTTLARFNAEPRSIPLALFDTNKDLYNATTNPSSWSDFPGAVFGTNSDDNLSLAQAAPEAGDVGSQNSFLNQSAMGHFHRVFSETHRVPASGEILLNFPYLGVPDTTAFNAALNPIIKIRRDVEGVKIDENGALDFSSARLDGTPFMDTDGTPGHSVRPPVMDTSNYLTAGKTSNNREDVTFYVSYNWRNAGNYTNGVQNEPKTFPSDSSPTWTGAGSTAGKVAQALVAGNTVLAGPVKVWFYSSAAATDAQQGDADYDPNLGRLLLPTLAGQLVSVDYTVPDWRFIVTDNNLTTQISDTDSNYIAEQGVTIDPTNPTANISQLILPTRYVADEPIGDSNTQLYALLRGTDSTNAPIISHARWSNVTGVEQPTADQPASGKSYRPIAIRPKTGQVFFDIKDDTTTTTPKKPLISPFSRVVYRNIEGWVQQPAIAANFYTPYIDDNSAAFRALFPREPWREYFYLPNNAESRIFLHASEAGKSLTVSYVYQEGSNYITMKDVPVPIEGNVQERPSVVPTAFNGKYLLNGTATDSTKVSVAYLRDNEGRSIGGDSGNGGNTKGARIIAISEIRGASIRVRSGWFEGSRYTQTAVVGYRPLDVESYNRS